jgi:TolA protein
MKATEAQRRAATTSTKESFTASMVLSAVVHGILFLGIMIVGGTWLFGAPVPSGRPSYTVDLVETPDTLRVPAQSVDEAAQSSEQPPPKPSSTPAPALAAPPPVKPSPAESQAPEPPPAKSKTVEPEDEPAPASEPKVAEPPPAAPKTAAPQARQTAESAATPPQHHEPAPKSETPRPQEHKQTVPPLAKASSSARQKQPKPPEASSPEHAKPSKAATKHAEASPRRNAKPSEQAALQPAKPQPTPRPAPARKPAKPHRASAGSGASSSEAEQAQQRAAEQRLSALRAKYGADGTSGTAAETGGTTAGLTDALSQVRLRAYQQQVREQIIAAWILPLPRDQARSLQATALFTVDRGGRITRLRLLEPSGNTLFDESLLRAIQLAAPLPMLPEDYGGTFLDIEIRFRPYDS